MIDQMAVQSEVILTNEELSGNAVASTIGLLDMNDDEVIGIETLFKNKE